MIHFLMHTCASTSHVITNQYCSISYFINKGICFPLHRVVPSTAFLLLLFNLVLELGFPNARARSFVGIQLPLLSSYNFNFPFIKYLQ